MIKYSKKTQKLVDDLNSKGFVVGDIVTFYGDGNGSRNPKHVGSGEIIKINGDQVSIQPNKHSGGRGVVLKNISDIKQSILYVGNNPLKERRFHQKYQFDISQLLSRMGYNNYGELDDDKIGIKVDGVIECNDNPVVKHKDEYIFYQRDLVWDIVDKQKLIRSLYDGMPIGNFVFRDKSYDAVIAESKDESRPTSASWRDLVDGKQRFEAILSFIRSEYTDHYGNYWNDLSISARNQFLTITNLMYIEMHDSTTDAEVLEFFILLNDTGRRIDQRLLNTNREILERMVSVD